MVRYEAREVSRTGSGSLGDHGVTLKVNGVKDLSRSVTGLLVQRQGSCSCQKLSFCGICRDGRMNISVSIISYVTL